MKTIINLFLFLLVLSSNSLSMEKQEPCKKISPQELAVLRAQPFAYQKLPTEIQYIIRKFAGLEEPANQQHAYYSQLQQAINNYDTDTVQILIALGVNPNETPYRCKCRPLTWGIWKSYHTDNENEIQKKKQINIVSYLLKHGADVNLKNENNTDRHYQQSPIFQAIEHPENIAILQILLQHKNIDFKIEDEYNRTVGNKINACANNHAHQPEIRKKYYEMATMLKNAQAPSTIELKPLPSDQTMEIEYQNWHERAQSMELIFAYTS